MGNSLADLNSLVRDWHMKCADIRSLQRLHKPGQFLVFIRCCDQQKLIRLAGQDALYGLPELLEIIVDRGNDDCYIFRSIRRVFGNRDRFVAPMAYKVDNGSDVAMKPARSQFRFEAKLYSQNVVVKLRIHAAPRRSQKKHLPENRENDNPSPSIEVPEFEHFELA